MYIAVCDDQAEELKMLEGLLALWQSERGTALRFKSFRSAAELLDAAGKERFTLYLLDVMMPGTDGLAAAREIRGFDGAADIVFLTSSPGFAYESYGVRALDYLLKPIRGEMLFPILDRLARPEFMQVHRSYIVNMLQVSELSQAGIRTFSGKNLPVSRLLYPQVQKDYMKLLFAKGEG